MLAFTHRDLKPSTQLTSWKVMEAAWDHSQCNGRAQKSAARWDVSKFIVLPSLSSCSGCRSPSQTSAYQSSISASTVFYFRAIPVPGTFKSSWWNASQGLEAQQQLAAEEWPWETVCRTGASRFKSFHSSDQSKSLCLYCIINPKSKLTFSSAVYHMWNGCVKPKYCW